MGAPRFHHLPCAAAAFVALVQVPPSEIGYINSLVEGYEGMSLFRTRDETRGIVEFIYTQDNRADFEKFLDALEREIPIRRMAVEQHG